MTPPPDLEQLVQCWLLLMAFALLVGIEIPPRPPRPRPA